MARKTDVLVIGGGPAGITFSRVLRKLRPDCSVTMLRPEEYSMVYCAIPYAIEGLFDAEKVYKKDSIVTEVGVELVRRRAVSVDFDEQSVTDDEGETYTYDTLFITTGAIPVLPPIPGATASNVFTVKTQTDMNAILGQLREKNAQRAVVVGAGAIGIEQAQAYRQCGLDVHLIDIAPRVLPNMIDDDMKDPLQEALVAKGIHLVLGTSVEAMETCDGAVTKLILSEGPSIDLDPAGDFVCFGVGMKPDLALFEGSTLALQKDGIVVDAQMRTNIQNVYAAGDCCSFHSAIDGKPIGGKLATNAVPMGKVAARNVAGDQDEYAGFLNGCATCAYDYRIGATGFTEEIARKRGFEPVCGFGSVTSMFPMMPGATEVRSKLVADAATGRIIGGQILGQIPSTDKIDTITLAIQSGMTAKQLSKLSYSSQPWQSFFPARNVIVEACEQIVAILSNQ